MHRAPARNFGKGDKLIRLIPGTRLDRKTIDKY